MFRSKKTSRSVRKRYNTKRGFSKLKPRKKYNKVSSLSLRSPTTAPDRLRLKMSYNTYVSLTSGVSGTPFAQYFRNSCFDPDFTGGGNQPLGFDQWSNFYAKYRVYGVGIRVEGCNTGSTVPLLLAIYPSLGTTPAATVAGTLSQPYAKTRTLGISTGESRATIKHYMSTKKMWGFKSIDQEDNFAALTTANPTNQWYWSVYGYAGTGATPTFQGHIKLTFYVEMFDRIEIDIS